MRVSTLLLMVGCLSFTAQAAEDDEAIYKLFPFAAASEYIDFAAGLVFVVQNAGQKDATFLATGFYSTNDSYAVLIDGFNYRFPRFPRLLFDFMILTSDYPYGIYFVDGNPDFVGQPAGTNDSSIDNFIYASANPKKYEFDLQYLFPTGGGKGGISEALKRETAGKGWNPLKNGMMTFSVTPYFYSQTITNMDTGAVIQDEQTQGYRFSFDWDNLSAKNNPTYGGRTIINYSYDPGREENPSYEFAEFSQSLIFPIFGTPYTTQQSLAVNFYVAETTTWHDKDDQGRYERPPYFAGATLGGYYHLRGYSKNRYHDRSAVSYSFEYRVLPTWQPMYDWPIFRNYDVPWWQWVIYYDLGRVDDGLHEETFVDDLHWSVGFGARFQIQSILVRLEYAVAEDDSQFVIMVNQPF